MPQRFLRPGITTSQRFNAVTWPAQSLFTRIITLVDDFGRYDADFRLLRSHAFPFGDPVGKDVSQKSLEGWCKELESAGLCEFYETEDKKRYLQITRWQERSRSQKSKYPSISEACRHFLRNPAESCGILPPSSSSSSSSLHPRHSSNGSQANASEPSDEEWLLELSKSKAYQGIDVPREFSKMEQWCKTARKNPSRRRFINWLNKCERPIRTDRPLKPLDPAKIEVPSDFKVWATGKYENRAQDIAGFKTWADVPDWMRVEWKRERINPILKSVGAAA